MPVAVSTVSALAAISEPERATHNYCMACDANLLRVEKITLRVIEVMGEVVVYGLCPKCTADLFKSNRKRNRVERRAEKKIRELMVLEATEVGGDSVNVKLGAEYCFFPMVTSQWGFNHVLRNPLSALR